MSLSQGFMSAYKIFISSPGDVDRERHQAEQVIRRVTASSKPRRGPAVPLGLPNRSESPSFLEAT